MVKWLGGARETVNDDVDPLVSVVRALHEL